MTKNVFHGTFAIVLYYTILYCNIVDYTGQNILHCTKYKIVHEMNRTCAPAHAGFGKHDFKSMNV